MLWVYDNAIIQDLTSCIDPQGEANNTVKSIGEEGMLGVYAQLQEDRIKFPAIFIDRHPETPLDSRRYNFSRMKKGVPAAFDPDKNNIYFEKAVPIELGYDLHVLTTNTIDMDEMLKEILFRYSSMYFITVELPYESKRKIHFGIGIDPDAEISRKSATSDYIQSGRLYESIIQLRCEGAVLLSYTPRHLQGLAFDQNITLHSPLEKNL